MTMAPKYILNYFDLPGRAEAVRIMFHAAGVEFTDNRLDRLEWNKQKFDIARFPLSQMPTLQVDDKVICQSSAIFRYVASEYGFYGENTCEQVNIDQICETLNDIGSGVVAILYGGHDEEAKKTKFQEYFKSDQVKRQWSFINNILKNNNDGKGYIVGKKLSLADILLYCINLLLERFNPNNLQDYPELNSLIERVVSEEKIKKYLDSQKRKYVLNYFDAKGKGETIRLMFHAAGVEFTDNRISRENWINEKTDSRRFPLGQMPTLEVNDHVICQSAAIYRSLARKFGFYGATVCEQTLIDQVFETLEDIGQSVVKIHYGGFDDDTKKVKYEEMFASEQFKRQLSFLQKMLKNNSTGSGYFVGSKVSLADFHFFSMNGFLEILSPGYLDSYPEIKAVIGKIEGHENVKKYLDTQKN